MFGFVVGTLCLFGLFHMLRRAHYAYGGPFWLYGRRFSYACGHPPWQTRGRARLRSGRRRFALRWLFEQLDTTPGQEKVILKHIDTMRDQVEDGRDELWQARREVAQALGGDVLDHSVLSAALGRVEALFTQSKEELIKALTEVHGALDGRQRKELAELIAEGPGGYSARYREWH